MHIGDDELGSVFAMDKPVFGADRSFILRCLHNRNPDYAFCLKEKGLIRAYCMGRSGSQCEHVGPIIAEGYIHAADLLAALLGQMESKNAVIDAFAGKPDWISLLDKYGFASQRTLTRMCLGHLDHPDITEKQFAIAGPEIG
jgi:hypothetical protein